jgi:proline iminopeptidase
MADPRLSFGLSERIREDLQRVFARYPEVQRVLIFGSRAKGCEQPGSDIDLAVVAPALSEAEFARVWAAIDALPLIFKVDLLHWDRLHDDRLKQKIQAEGRVFFVRKELGARG